jgi:hypothetical protein
MKRKKIFGKNITFLIVGVLAVLAFIRGKEQIWFLGGVFAIFAIWTLCAGLQITFKRIKEAFAKRHFARAGKRKNRKPKDTDNENINDDLLLRHVNCRISEYLKSVYPEITWEWQSENPENLASEGGTGRIRLYGITDFNYADVTLDGLAQLDCKMIKIVPFADLRKNGGSEPEKKQNKPSPADPEAWYSIQGKKVLENCVADLNSKGHDSLTIKENGDICFLRADNEIVRDRFTNFPNKSSWQALVKIIEKQGLSASATDKCIKVSW